MFNLGVDVSKQTLDCLLLLQDNPLKMKHKTLENNPEGYLALQQWVGHHLPAGQPWQVIMEATGVYHEKLANALYQAGIPVIVVNPAQLRHYAKALALKSKNDRLDAVAIARFGLTHTLKQWTPPSAEVRDLTQLLARLEAVEKDRQREKNRLEKATFTDTTPDVLQSLEASIHFLEQQYQSLKQTMDARIELQPKLKKDRDLLRSIPAVGDKTSLKMTIFFNRYHFDNAPQAAHFLGLIPVEHQSGSSVHKPTRLAKSGHANLRALLYMAAMVGMTHNPDIRALYQRLCNKGKAKKAALGAAMRKLVHICFGVLKYQTPYQPMAT